MMGCKLYLFNKKIFFINLFNCLSFPGNNRLGGQDFNQRLLSHLKKTIHIRYGNHLTDSEDLQSLLLHAEEMKINLTRDETSEMTLYLHSIGQTFSENVTRVQFEEMNSDLFKKVLEPIRKVLESVEMTKYDINEIVLVGGSTRIPRVRQLIAEFFEKEPNTSVDPELAVVSGVAIQAGIIGGVWPLTVSAVELPTQVKKIQL